MYKNYLYEPEFDFVLSKNTITYSRDYSIYEVFNIDVTKSLYSTSGVIQSTGVTMNNVMLTGYDNGLLNSNYYPEYSGTVIVNNAYSYTFVGNNTLLTNVDVEQNELFDKRMPLLIECDIPLITGNTDTLVMSYVTDDFSLNLTFSYEDGVINACEITTTNDASTENFQPDDRVSIYIVNENFFIQKNGITIFDGLFPGDPLISSYIGFFTNNNSEFTINNLRIYNQKSLLSDTSFDITDAATIGTPSVTGITITTSGVTYTVGKTPFQILPISNYIDTYDYTIINELLSDIEQQYNKLDGGFYQGFFKLYNYPVEYFKSRAHKGWTLNLLITNPGEYNGTGTTINSLHPENNGFIFYLGTRAENKYYTVTGDAISTLNTVLGLPHTGDTLVIDTVVGETISSINPDIDYGLFNEDNLYTDKPIFIISGTPYSGYYNIHNGVYYTGRTYNVDNTAILNKSDLNKFNDIINNCFGVFIDSDGRIGYKNVYKTDPCFTGTSNNPVSDIQNVSGITNDSFVDITTECDNNTIEEIRTQYFTIRKVISKNPIIEPNGEIDRFLYLSIVFERDFSYNSDCMLKYGKHKIGTLNIYINGKLVFKDDHFIEVIPHELDTNDFYQEGVPFNISFGGGSQGLLDSVNVLGDYTSPPDKLIIDEFFSGTYMGGVKNIQMYMAPLYVTEIIAETIKIKNDYDLYMLQGGRRVLLKTIY